MRYRIILGLAVVLVAVACGGYSMAQAPAIEAVPVLVIIPAQPVPILVLIPGPVPGLVSAAASVQVEADRRRRVALDKARLKLGRRARALRKIVAVIRKAEAKRAWARQHRQYIVTHKTRHRCPTCDGRGKIMTAVKYGTKVRRCTRCGGDGTYETKSFTTKTRDLSGMVSDMRALRNLEATAAAEYAAAKLAVEALAEK